MESLDWQTLPGETFQTIAHFLPMLVAVPIGLVIHRVTMRLLHHSAKGRWKNLLNHLVPRSSRALLWVMLLLAVTISIGFTNFTDIAKGRARLLLQPALIGVIGWLSITLILGTFEWLSTRFKWQDVADNLSARRVSTQLRVFRNIAVFFVVVVTVTVMAMSIPSLHNLGVSLFASAGVAGLVIGMAARPALANVIAGVQLALAQPIRLDDVVIVEGEWGRIQEINATYVVVNIWDQRRLVVPLSYFIEKPFQNWTHTTSDLLGTAYLYLDYNAPIDAIREELKRILDNAKEWDKRVGIVQVTETKESTIEVRVLVSSHNSGDLFNLRCDVREKLISFLKDKHPECLPRTRAELLNQPNG